MYKQVVALDPDGKKGTTEYGRNKDKVSYTQYAEFNIGTGSMSARPPDPAALLAFVKKYPDSQIVKDGYSSLSRLYGRAGLKEDATKFFEGYAARFPKEGSAYSGWVTRILFDKDPVDKGIELSPKAIELAQGRGVMSAYGNLARLYLLKGDKAKAVETADQMLKVAAAPPPAAKADAVPAVPMGGPPGMIPMGAPPGMTAVPMAAQIYMDAGRPEKALAVYGPEYISQNAKSSPTLGRYAQFWAQQGTNLESALAAAKSVTELTPNAYSSFNALAMVYQKMKNYGEALKAAEKALSLAPAQPPQIKEGIQKTIDSIKAATADKK
ncbi:MAG: tetratricopeptide repeat protein [Candidatus Aminicenantes bacterium]|nr:tetratricopeptide repeat protein [Candidatus Aminicenantes bacterium]